jgi:hypothetical protein
LFALILRHVDTHFNEIEQQWVGVDLDHPVAPAALNGTGAK